MTKIQKKIRTRDTGVRYRTPLMIAVHIILIIEILIVLGGAYKAINADREGTSAEGVSDIPDSLASGKSAYEPVEVPGPDAETADGIVPAAAKPQPEGTPADNTGADSACDVLNHYGNLFIASKVNSFLNLREEPSDESAVIGKLEKNGGGEILEDLGSWYRVRSGGIEGYVLSEYCVSGEEARALAPSAAVKMVRITAECLNVRSGPGLDFEILTQLRAGSLLPVEAEFGEWYKILLHHTDGYISKSYTEPGWYLAEAVPWSGGSQISEKRQQLLRYARQFIGIPYKMGGTSLGGDGIDCSSFVQQCLKNALGISLDRTSRQLSARGCEVSLDEAKPGDLMFYAGRDGIINHVAFYMGEEKILHASQSFGQVSVSAYNYTSEPVLIKNVIGD